MLQLILFSYNKMSDQTESSIINEYVQNTLTTAKNMFASRKTRSIIFRRDLLNKFHQGLRKDKKLLCEGVRKDLGRVEFATWMLELTLIENEIEHSLEHLNKWMQEIPVPTPMLVGPARSKIVYEP